MTRQHGILIIDSSDWDREQVRSYLRDLSRPVRVLQPRDIESEKARIDLIILGFSDDVSLTTSRAQLDRARAAFPQAQLILCAPPEVPGLDNVILDLKARAFLLKPLDEATFRTLLEDTLGRIQLRKEREEYARAAKKTSHTSDIVGTSDAMRSVMELIDRVAQSATTSVIFLGESGVGKSLFAQTVHDRCETAHGPFIEINCAALPSALLESELFGYEPGAFTDAKSQKIGLIELADGGTLFLDEITEVDLVTQAKLLKFLDSKKLRRLGGDREIAVEARVVAATNRDLKEEVRRGRFREDLYYRLNVVEVHIPPLRERREDIDSIARYYLDYYKRKFNKSRVDLSVEAWSLIRSYPWPGNARELINVLERAVLLVPGDRIEPEHLPIEMPAGRRRLSIERRGQDFDVAFPPGPIDLERLERAAVEEMLRRTRGNVSRAAELLGISRGALRNKLARFSIDARAYARPAAALPR
jgi:transcriptional regulator with PAS, ATPase and Fis domain